MIKRMAEHNVKPDLTFREQGIMYRVSCQPSTDGGAEYTEVFDNVRQLTKFRS